MIEKRSVAARIGIAALNVVAPGLGLLRVQDGRAASLLLLAPLALLALVILGYMMLPTLNFASWATLLAVTLAALLAIYLIAIVRSWRASYRVLPPGPWWSRWYGMAGIILAVWTLTALLPDITQSTYKTFYTPAEGMTPTLLRNDRIVASMRGPGDLHRGDIIIFDVDTSFYVKRVAALPGDRIAMENGIVILNGRPVAQHLMRIDRVEPGVYGTRARRLAEQLPGEAQPHEIYDLGNSPGDEMPEQRVLPGHVFVLGDNRDQSADSRYPRREFGVEQLPIGDIRGRALFYLWGPSGRLGEALNF